MQGIMFFYKFDGPHNIRHWALSRQGKIRKEKQVCLMRILSPNETVTSQATAEPSFWGQRGQLRPAHAWSGDSQKQAVRGKKEAFAWPRENLFLTSTEKWHLCGSHEKIPRLNKRTYEQEILYYSCILAHGGAWCMNLHLVHRLACLQCLWLSMANKNSNKFNSHLCMDMVTSAPMRKCILYLWET